MICEICKKDANDNACAYYNVGKDVEVWKCWFCLATHEKLERDLRFQRKLRFKGSKTVETIR